MTDTKQAPHYDDDGVFVASCGCTLMGDGLPKKPCATSGYEDWINRGTDGWLHHVGSVRIECILHERQLREQLLSHPTIVEQIAYDQEQERLAHTAQPVRIAYRLGAPVRFDACLPGPVDFEGELYLVTLYDTKVGYSITGGQRKEFRRSTLVRPVLGPLPIAAPVHVPTDSEIVDGAESTYPRKKGLMGLAEKDDYDRTSIRRQCFVNGAKWMREQMAPQQTTPVDPFDEMWNAGEWTGIWGGDEQALARFFWDAGRKAQP